MLTITIAERRARLGHRHHLAALTNSPEDVADGVVALHATDPATVFLSAIARMQDPSIPEIEAALFDRRSMMRTLAMRRTLWVPSTTLLRTVEVSSAGAIARTERNRLEKFLAESDIDRPRQWLQSATDQIVDALSDGPLSAKGVTKAVPILGTKITMGAGTKSVVQAGATSRTLGLLAVEGLLARGRPAGGWTGRQYEWHRRDHWLPIPDDDSDEPEASAALIEAWLRRFGPATLNDIQWWTGWTKTKTKAAVARLDTAEVVLEGESELGIVLADDVEQSPTPDTWVRFLPSLDPTSMGWKDRAWYVDGHEVALFDRMGNIGPGVWHNGRIIGVWSQNAENRLAWTLFTSPSKRLASLVSAEADRVTAVIADTSIRPSFPTPVQKELAAQTTVGMVELH